MGANATQDGSRITTQDGTQIYYKDWGAGQPVVFSHGWPLNGDAWENQMLFLAQNGYRTIAHDRRGHGRSDQPSEGNEMDTYADDLAALSDGSTDLYIRQDLYHQQFAADVPAERTALMAVGQRPLRDVAVNGASGPPAWKSIPSWFVFGELDKNIPAASHRFMAERAGAREVVEIEGASHAVGVSHPEEVADMILRAAKDVE